MLVTCWSVKGGSGTTVVAAALAVITAGRGDTLLVDLAGDLPAALGLPEPAGPGVTDWLHSPAEVGPEALGRLEVPALPGLALLPCGARGPGGRTDALSAALVAAVAGGRAVVVDAGVADATHHGLLAASTASLLVLRPCYLALRRAVASPVRPTAAVLVREPGRALTRRDVASVLGVPVQAEIDLDPAVARAVDAGLLASRLPRALERTLRHVA